MAARPCSCLTAWRTCRPHEGPSGGQVRGTLSLPCLQVLSWKFQPGGMPSAFTNTACGHRGATAKKESRPVRETPFLSMVVLRPLYFWSLLFDFPSCPRTHLNHLIASGSVATCIVQGHFDSLHGPPLCSSFLHTPAFARWPEVCHPGDVFPCTITVPLRSPSHPALWW